MKTPALYLQLKLFLVLVILIISSGCTVSLIDHTPSEFPAQVEDLPLPENTLYPGSTLDQLIELGNDPKHRFILEVKPKNVSNIKAFILIDGNQSPMNGDGSGLWTYESPNECNGSYSYYYIVRYRAGLYGNRSTELESAESPFTTSVTNFGKAIWYVSSLGIPNSGDGEIPFVAGAEEEYTVIVQNLRNTPISVYSIGISDMAGITDNDQFQVLDVPTLPVQLGCGESIKFKVRWNPPTTISTARGAMRILANPIGGSAWFRTIILKGLPHPE